MTDSKRIMVYLPVSLLKEVDGITSSEKKNRSELVKEAMRFYLEEKRKVRLREQMRAGYLEMAKINLALVNEFYYCEEEASSLIDHRLAKRCL